MKPYATQPLSPKLPYYAAPDSFLREFRRPAGSTRPRMRWWVPSPYLSEEGIETNIRAMAEAGFSGAEVCPMPRFDIPGGRHIIEWGTPRWKALSKHMLETAARYDFTIDFTMTPFWPLALPVITDASDPEQGAQMEADGAYVDGITARTPYSGKVPVSAQAVEDAAGVGTLPRLVAVTVAMYADKSSKTLCYSSARALVLGTEVLPDPADPLSWQVTFTPEEGEYVLFGWWEHPSGDRTCRNLQLDHYGPAATRVLTDYWERELIPCYGEDFVHTVAMFIDSLEYQTHLDWTRGFLDAFREQNGYDLAPYLPALYDEDSTGCFVDFPVPDFRFDRCNDQLINDYGEFLTRLYIENHLDPLTAFCERHGVSLRYQTAYGKTLELCQTAMHVAIPETETLYGGDILDFYRLQSGAMHLARKPIYSIEASAEMNGRGGGGVNSGNYQQTWGNQLWHVQRAMACCVNQIVFHGYSYEGYYDGEDGENGFMPGAHWPGYTTMGYSEFSNNWGPCQPNWLHVNHYTDFLARNQLVLRHGTGKIDLAIYRHSYTETIDFNGAVKLYDDGGLLEQSGYSYDFISPAAMVLPNGVVSEKRLDSDGPAYQALIINGQEAIPLAAAEKLLEYARAGLPILFVGAAPTRPAFHREGEIAPIMERLLALPCVQRLESTGEVPAALEALGVRPAARYRERAAILNTCRHTEAADYYFFYNYGDADIYPQALEMPAAATAVTLRGTGVPCRLDAWTGMVTPIAAYESTADSVTIPLALAKNDSCIVALVREPKALNITAPQLHASSTALHAEYDAEGALLATSSGGGAVAVPLSDGRTVQASFPPLPQKIELTGWALTLEKWADGPLPPVSVKTLHTFRLEHPTPWKELPGMEYASGVGTYRTSFALDKAWEEGIGYRLELGRVCDSYSVEVNGRDIPANQSDTSLDIGRYLRRGENTVVVTVASTLLNALIDYSRRHDLRDSWDKPDQRSPDAYGILGDVFLVPYAWTKIL